MILFQCMKIYACVYIPDTCLVLAHKLVFGLLAPARAQCLRLRLFAALCDRCRRRCPAALAEPHLHVHADGDAGPVPRADAGHLAQQREPELADGGARALGVGARVDQLREALVAEQRRAQLRDEPAELAGLEREQDLVEDERGLRASAESDVNIRRDRG